MLTAAELADMQSIQLLAMPGSVVIERYTSTRDPMGGMTEAWTAIGTVPGRIYPAGQRRFDETLGGNQIISEGRWFATLPVGTDVTAKDRLLSDNRTFEVVRVNSGESWRTAVRCECVTHNDERKA